MNSIITRRRMHARRSTGLFLCSSSFSRNLIPPGSTPSITSKLSKDQTTWPIWRQSRRNQQPHSMDRWLMRSHTIPRFTIHHCLYTRTRPTTWAESKPSKMQILNFHKQQFTITLSTIWTSTITLLANTNFRWTIWNHKWHTNTRSAHWQPFFLWNFQAKHNWFHWEEYQTITEICPRPTIKIYSFQILH